MCLVMADTLCWALACGSGSLDISKIQAPLEVIAARFMSVSLQERVRRGGRHVLFSTIHHDPARPFLHFGVLAIQYPDGG